MSLSASIFVLFLLVASTVPLLGGPGTEALIPKASGSYLEVAVDNDLRIWGDRDTKTFGASIASGDLDGDGYDDIAIGVPESDHGRRAGAVLVYFARDRDELQPAFGFGSADTVIEGINEGDRFGYAVEIEDLDSDGRSELIASAPYADGPGNGRRDAGDVYFVEGMGREEYGLVAGIENLTAWGVVYGKDAGDHLGVRLAFGDLDGNGTLDLVLGNEGTGGTPDCKPEGGTNAGAPNAENGIIGSWEVDVILRKEGPLGTYNLADNTSSVRWYGADTNQNSDNNLIATHIGNGLGAGDFDGDGTDDIVFTYRLGAEGYLTMCKGGPGFPYIGDYYKGRRDYSYVFPDPGISSNNPHPMFYPNLTIELGTDGYEEALLCLGEADGDNVADILVGMTGATALDTYRHKAGQVDLYLGGPITTATLDRTEAVWTFYGTDGGDRMGSSLAMIDRDSDGKCEFFVGSPY
jgi:hypothetical protein